MSCGTDRNPIEVGTFDEYRKRTHAGGMEGRLRACVTILAWLAIASCATSPTLGSDRGQAIAHFDKAVAFYARARYQDAIDQYQLALQDWPGYTEAHFGLGVGFIKTGFNRGAILALQLAIQRKPA